MERLHPTRGHPKNLLHTPRAGTCKQHTKRGRHHQGDDHKQVIRDDISHKKILTEPTKVKLKDTKIIPYRASMTSQILMRYQGQADAYIKKLIDQGIITKVTEPTPWCCHAFFIPKPNGKYDS